MNAAELNAKYPELYPVYEKLVAERDALTAGLAELEAESEKLYAKVEEARKAWEASRAKVVAKEQNGRLREVSNQIAALARSMGAKGVKAEAGTMGVARGDH